MKENKYTVINAEIKKPATLTSLGNTVYIRIICKPQYAVSVWSDKKLAKKIVRLGKRKGEDIYYDPELNVVTQRYKGKTEKEIVEIIKRELNSTGGKIK